MTDPEDSTKQMNSKYKDGINRNARLIVRNISFKATEETLKQHFSEYGTVEEVKLLRKPNGQLVGCGFVHYTHVSMANKALAATDRKPFMDRPIQVAWAVPKHKYTEQNQTKSDKSRSESVIKDEKKPIIENDTPTEMTSKKEELRKMRVNRNARLIVRNVSFKATEESLKEHFEPYGVITEVKLLKKPDGKLVGCAFVHFKNVPMAKKALLNTNMKPFLGRPISVDWAVAKNTYMQHIVNRQLEMAEDVKKEEPESDDDQYDDIKQEIKSDEEESDSDKESGDEEESDSDKESDDEGESEDKAESDEADEEDINQYNQMSMQQERQRIKLHDAEDGCTVFITNIPFSVDNDMLQQFAEQTGPVKYALVCVDKLTEHSKGSGFVKFTNKKDADTFLALPGNQLRLEGQTLTVKPALKRENLQKGSKKEAKDNRNLYLVKEGVVVAGTRAAEGVSGSDMAKRLALERSKTQMLKNLNRFVSKYRLVVSNLPQHCDDARLRRLCSNAAGKHATITEARVMRDLRSTPGNDGKQPSKGYGFVMFMRHEDALTCLRKLNNNPDIFDKNNRPIVSFSIEDRTVLNARKRRLEKSIANNPLVKKDVNTDTEEGKKRNRKRKNKTPPDESYVKKGRYGSKEDFNSKQDNEHQPRQFSQRGQFKTNNSNKFNKKNKSDFNKFDTKTKEHLGEYSGLTAKEGSQHKLRNNQKLRTQADIHRQNVKLEKKKSQQSIRLKKAAKERIKLPKQKKNKSNAGKKKRLRKPRTVF